MTPPATVPAAGSLPLLQAAPQLYLAIETSDGPLVTPELHAVSGDRVWIMTGKRTAKARLLSDGARVGVCAISEDPAGAVALGGTVQMFDALRPETVLRKLGLASSALVGLASFVKDNALELAGAATQAVKGELGVPPDSRVLISIDPCWTVVGDGDGEWVTSGHLEPGSATDRTEPLPQRRQPDAETGRAVLGWTNAAGPLALPGRWDSKTGHLEVDRRLFEACGAASQSAGSMCIDSWSGLGPAGKQGFVYRGTGWAEQGPTADLVFIALDVERKIEWDGIETRAHDLG